MLKKYDKELSAIPFLSTHANYLPFVGDDYEHFRVLHVGESHYINQTPENCTYDLSYMMSHWWDYSLDEEFLSKNEECYNTRDVLFNYLSGNRRRGHSIFTNFLKGFSDAVLEETISHITLENSQKYNYFAFMNYFQMPSLYWGMKFWDSLVRCAGNGDEALDAWNKTVQVSTEVLDKVIDIIHPSLVIITSKSAYNAYKESKGAHATDSIVINAPHPGCKYWTMHKQQIIQEIKAHFEGV